MNADEFVNKVIEPTEWMGAAKQDIRNADLLWEEGEENLFPMRLEGGELREPTQKALDHLTGSIFLMAMAVENALKAKLISDRPEDVELRLSLNAKGEKSGAELKEIGGNPLNHNLEKMAEHAGIFDRSTASLFEDSEEYERLRRNLNYLGHAVRYGGKYPTSNSLDDHLELEEIIEEMNQETTRDDNMLGWVKTMRERVHLLMNHIEGGIESVS